MAQMSSTNTTYKISFKKIARAALAEVRVHKKLAIITFVLYGVALLLFWFNSFDVILGGTENSPQPVYTEYWASGWGMFFAGCGAVVGYFTVLNVFRDMNNQQICDVSMALPIKASERFFSKLLCLCFIQILPQLVCVLGGNGIRIILARILYGELPGEVTEYLFKLVFGYLAAEMFAMSIVVLCVCCCGAPAESSYFSIILMVIINVLPLCFVYHLVSNCAGLPYWFGDMKKIDFGYWGFLYLADFNNKFILHCAVGCVISLAVMLLSGLIYVRRDAKTVGTPIASRVFFEVTMTLGVVTVFLFFVLSFAALWGLLIAAVAYIIINIIVSRAKINVLSFVKWGGKYLITAAAFLVVAVTAIKTGGFGFIYERPAAEHLHSAEYTISYYEIGDTSEGVYLRTDELTSEQADKVMSICKKHLANGRANINPFIVIFDDLIFSSDTAHVRIAASGSKHYDKPPYPKSQFIDDYNNFSYDDKYILNYWQSIEIPIADARAMTEELKALGYVYVESENGSVSTDVIIEHG